MCWGLGCRECVRREDRASIRGGGTAEVPTQELAVVSTVAGGCADDAALSDFLINLLVPDCLR